jgi:hypothetical protein
LGRKIRFWKSSTALLMPHVHICVWHTTKVDVRQIWKTLGSIIFSRLFLATSDDFQHVETPFPSKVRSRDPVPLRIDRKRWSNPPENAPDWLDRSRPSSSWYHIQPLIISTSADRNDLKLFEYILGSSWKRWLRAGELFKVPPISPHIVFRNGEIHLVIWRWHDDTMIGNGLAYTVPTDCRILCESNWRYILPDPSTQARRYDNHTCSFYRNIAGI